MMPPPSLCLKTTASTSPKYLRDIDKSFLQFGLTGFVIDDLVGVLAGAYGWNITSVPMDKLTISLKVLFSSQWFFCLAVAAFRLGILCLYLELFRGDWFRRCTIATMALVTLYWIASVLTIALLCRPINANWDITISRTCGDITKVEFASGSFNLTVDLLIVSLPMPVVWGLNMPKEKKIGVTTAFLLGLITAGVNIERIIQTKTCDGANITYCALDASILCMAEITCGIMVSCAPTLGPLFFRSRVQIAKPPEVARRGLRTFGSIGRSLSRRKQRVDTVALLGSLDDELERGGEGIRPQQMAHLPSPGVFYQTNPSQVTMPNNLSGVPNVSAEMLV
ncbi:hypothetical protein ASPTUDRAFT_76171 [Aspergillus tubingensis CBS 134.48]|uniref:Rhodopsin domain-containing protein n=1 Tax=Aspergillus tubingensis (strain CBS 134.48) TaxID=767770 RepID=A0A1L9MZL2_ASPTC|nr:hypothetical protein ASPTUDRAFT_76171 [Aspergillus tubingensis CBS 134.48]